MSVLERRLQVLLDQERFDRLSRESAATGRSIGALVREAIDLRYPAEVDIHMQAARGLLDLAGRDATPEPDWPEVKAELERDLARRLP